MINLKLLTCICMAESLCCSPETITALLICYNAAAAKSLQSCLTLCDPTDGSPPGSPIPGILQARTLEWVAISFSNAWKWKVKVKTLSRARLLSTPWTAAHQAPRPWDFPGKSTGVGCHRLLPINCYWQVIWFWWLSIFCQVCFIYLPFN